MRIPGKFIQIKPGGGIDIDPVLGIYVNVSTGGSEMEAGVATINFGATGTNIVILPIIGQTGITADSSIFVSKRLVDVADTKAMEVLIRNVELGAINVKPGIGFDICALSRRGKQKGVLKVNWFWY